MPDETKVTILRDQCCGNCYFYRPNTDRPNGQCRHELPKRTVMKDSAGKEQPRAVFVPMTPGGWCGQWKQHPDGIAPEFVPPMEEMPPILPALPALPVAPPPPEPQPQASVPVGSAMRGGGQMRVPVASQQPANPNRPKVSPIHYTTAPPPDPNAAPPELRK